MIMLRKIKIGKIATVLFLTVLIWVWQDLALDEEFAVTNARILAPRSPENLWISFKNRDRVPIDEIQLKGPASKITELKGKANEGTLEFIFPLNPTQEGITTAGSRNLNVLDFVKRSDKMKEYPGLTVQSCEPEIIDVNVVELTERPLDIECFDESGAPLKAESIEPRQVTMFAPADTRLRARVQLTRRDIERARNSFVVKTPYIILAPDQERQATRTVRIRIPSEANPLSEYSITGANLGIVQSGNIVGKYDVEVTNPGDLTTFSILATLEAKQAYENESFKIMLYILDGDANEEPDKELEREVVYNFPEEYVRRNEIRLKDEQPKKAKFKLKKLPLTDTP